MKIEEHKSLKNYNTFGIDCKARFFISVTSKSELLNALNSNIHSTLLIMGGGSNMLLTKDIDALVIHIDFKGIKILSEDDNHIYLSVMGGENWHEFVQYCINHNYGGVENLSLIPGNVGTAPIQNIGAYGVELKTIFESCNTILLEDLSENVFLKSDCKFGYRNSIFKNELKNKCIISEVVFKLTKKNHNKNINYGAIQEILSTNKIETPSIKDISEAVIKIRQSKLPDPKILGNSGSFFKNPILTKKAFDDFISKYPNAPFYKVSKNEIKIPAGWLIEEAGFKGKRIGDAGVHKNQALVLVNYGNATGLEILALAKKIQETIWKKFEIQITPEVNIL